MPNVDKNAQNLAEINKEEEEIPGVEQFFFKIILKLTLLLMSIYEKILRKRLCLNSHKCSLDDFSSSCYEYIQTPFSILKYGSSFL